MASLSNPQLSTAHSNNLSLSESKDSRLQTIPHRNITDPKLFIIDEKISKSQIIKEKAKTFVNNFSLAEQENLSIIQFLENKNIAFTGVNSHYYKISKEELLNAAICSNLRLPKSYTVYSTIQLQTLSLDFSNIVIQQKINQQIITVEQSVSIPSREVLESKINDSIDRQGEATVQESVKGRQFVCLAYNSGHNIISLEPIEKVKKGNAVTLQLVGEKLISQKLKQNAKSLMKILSLSGYLLFSFTLSADQIYLTQFKPSPIIQSKTNEISLLSTILSLNQMQNFQFLQMMVSAAKIRQQNNSLNYQIKFNNDKNTLGLYALNDIEAGNIIFEQQNLKQNIIVVDWVKNHFDSIQWGSFWSRMSSAWKPISHSCDPNATAQESSLKSIRKIVQGEEITVDFSTIIYHDLVIQCSCQSANCKGTISMKCQKQDWFKAIPQAKMHPWMRDLVFKQTLVGLINQSSDLIALQYEPGNCYAVAKRDISVGQRVSPLSDMPIVKYNNRYVITKHLNEFFDTTRYTTQFLNHKCQNYNLRINPDDSALVAQTFIPKGKLLTFNYLTTEYDVSFPFDCLCGEENCHIKIKGFKNLKPEVQEKIYKEGHCSMYIREKMEEN